MGKLVIIDKARALRFTVPDSDQIIGRGGFLECDDKRISRNHGMIRKESRGQKSLLHLESLHHTNPIFCCKNDKNFVLKENDTTLLEVGEKFRLLPDSEWFEVAEVCEPDSTAEVSSNAQTMNQCETYNPSSPEGSTSKRKHDGTGEPEDDSKRHCPTTGVDDEQPSTSSVPSPTPPQIKSDPDSSDKVAASYSDAVTIKPDPDSISTSNDAVQIVIKSDPDAAGCNDVAASVSAAAVNNLLIRPSCDFGIRCYRAGADHRSAFAHPGDLDYRRPNFPPAPAGSPLCPFGARCYRRNPQHFRDFDHPDPNADLLRRPRRQVVFIHQAGDNVSDDEYHDESEPDFDATSSDEYNPQGNNDASEDDDYDDEFVHDDAGNESADSGIND